MAPVSRRLLAEVLAELGGPWSARVVVGVERWLARMAEREVPRSMGFVPLKRYRLESLRFALGIDPALGNVPEPGQLASLAELESRASLVGDALRGES